MEALVDALKRSNQSSFSGAKDVIPNFDPGLKNQTIRSWLKKVNETAQIYDWNDREIIYNALPKLDGLAKRWYESLRTVKLNWAQWQIKLSKSFPDDRNYADRLIEMLDRRSRSNETLEEYFYDKLKLVNHCNINGRDAVDCIVQGVYDNNIRLNAQGANFKRPNKLLAFLRSISNKNSREHRKAPVHSKTDSGRNLKTNNTNTSFKPRCYNCSELGHTVPKCTKELRKCSKCNKLGHIADFCRRDTNATLTTMPNNDNGLNNKVQLINTDCKTSDIYRKNVRLNDSPKTAFIDFGSECTLITHSTASSLDLLISKTELPVLKGFAAGALKPVGKVTVEVSIDFVTATIEAFVVPDIFLETDMLIGQNLTELPKVIVYKNSTTFILYSEIVEPVKTKVYLMNDINTLGLVTVNISMEVKHTGLIYISGSSNLKEGQELIVLQGIYTIKDGEGKLIVVNFSENNVLKAGRCIARAILLPMLPEECEAEPNTFNICRITSNDSKLNQPLPLTTDMLKIGSEVTEIQKKKLLDLVNEYRDCFALSINELGTSTIADMHITLSDNLPVTYKPYRLPYTERIVVKDLINELLASNIIRESSSSYASPIVLVKKKNDEYRLCVDYRTLNKKTVKDSYPMPIIDDQLDRLNGKRYFSSLDLKSGYYQIPMAAESIHLTAFVTPDGHYEYTRMPFGLVNAPAVFQHMINKALGQDRFELALPYMDDILSPSIDVDEGLEKLLKIFKCLRGAGLTLNIDKCSFFETKLDYLGYEISGSGIRPGERKIEAVSLFPTPSNVHQVRQFVGLASFFRRFVPGFASIAKPLTMLTKANIPWNWEMPQEQAFQNIKSRLIKRPILALYDPKYTTEVHCDASKLGVGGILLQKADEESPLRPVAYFSKQTTKEEEFLHSYELETLAVVLSLKKFRIYLIGVPFKVLTDCNALRTTLTKRDLLPRIARWWLLLQEYNFCIEYRPGDRMKHVDALSRNPIQNRENDDLLNAREYEIMNITTTNWLHTVQMSDPKLKHMKTVLESSEKTLKEIITNFVLIDDKVYRKIGNQNKWVVPDGARWRICQLCHDEAGHFALGKTLDKIKHDYWFPKMNRFVRKYVEACLHCAYNKSATAKPTGYLHPIPKGNVPFHTLHMDHLGPFVRSKKGNSYILGIIDGFSKFIFIKAVKDVKTKTTIKVLQDIFDVIGSPKIIISDRGTSFTSAAFKNYARSIGAKHILNAVATPRANGQIERYNRTILNSLASSNYGQDEREWDTKTGKTQWSLNNSINKTTGKSPAEIVFGHRTIGSEEGIILNELSKISELNSTNVTSPVEEIREEAVNNTKTNQDYMKKLYDSTRAPPKVFCEDDLVMIPNHHNPTDGKSKKLCPKFRGPLKITKILENDRYEVSSIDGYSKRKYKSVYPADQLKKWVTFNLPDQDDNLGIDSNTENNDSN